jgi:GTPase
VILRATTHETTLVNFRHKKVISAEDGERGGTALMHGKTGEDLILDVPVGTIVSDLEDGTIICDLAKSGQTYRICEGGRG